MTPEKLLKPYNPAETEKVLYQKWEDAGLFKPEGNADIQKPGQVFSIVLPPPNVTGTLHLGHSAMLAIEDIMVRYHRMKGDKTLWIPGTDHAAIATQQKVENILYKEQGKTRYDFSRDEFMDMIKDFAQKSHDTIVNQVRAMGASIDWSREAYTLDDARSLAVRTAFKRMYDDGLIYRGHRIVNWDPKLHTTVSDDEIEWKEETVPFYYIKYGPFTIATARPETKFGDKYVVMHPADARYKKYEHGQKIEVEWINGPITATVIKDEAIDMEFGTGVMTITPWHDAIDFGIAERHDLDREQIIDLDGKLLPIAGDFAGLYIKKARPLIIEKLQEKGLLEKVDEKYTHRVSTNSRGGGMIEPQILNQWFIDVNKKFTLKNSKIDSLPTGSEVSLKELMKTVVEKKQIEILPEYFDKTYFHWIDNLHDWCISRQIIFGHQIPVWYKGDEVFCGIEKPNGEDWAQDPDTLDTWFSSGLWTFSTLGWPEQTDELATFHPTSVLETGYDILFFWVARMVLMTGYLLNDIPFKKVYLHGLVRDGKGQKMSKSLGNIIDPLVMIGKYGTDAVRLSLIMGTAPGTDSKLSEDKIRGYKNFANKIWNIARFVLTNTEDFNGEEKVELQAEDQVRLDELNKMIADITSDMENFRFYLAGEKIYHYVWHTFADEIIEATKDRVKGEDLASKRSAQAMLLQILKTSLKLLHPFMPFVTEEIWSMMPGENKMLMIEEWPN